MNKMQVFAAEFIGTFALVLIGVGSVAAAAKSGTGSGLVGVALAFGLTVAAIVTATGHISGGHLNPAVTLGLMAGGKVKAPDAMLYIVAQLAGALLASYVLVGLFDVELVGAGMTKLRTETPIISVPKGLLIEGLTTFILMFVIYGTAVDGRAPKMGGLFIGLTVALDILFAGPFTGASMNPARTFGPALALGFWTHHWVYWVGPIAGAVLATLIYNNLFLSKSRN